MNNTRSVFKARSMALIVCALIILLLSMMGCAADRPRPLGGGKHKISSVSSCLDSTEGEVIQLTPSECLEILKGE